MVAARPGGRGWRVRRQAMAGPLAGTSGRDQADELEGVRRLADEDVTHLGEQLQRLDAEVEGRDLDAARGSTTRQRSTPTSPRSARSGIRKADEVSTVTDTLSTGRYALACVQARVAGEPVPELRVPCFFNPQHGPSVTDVMWTRPGAARGASGLRAGRRACRQSREVPRCAPSPSASREGAVLGGRPRLPALRRGLLRGFHVAGLGFPAARLPGVAEAPPARSTAATTAEVGSTGAAGTAVAATTAGAAAATAATRRFDVG